MSSLIVSFDLFDQEIVKQGVSGEVATHHGVETYAAASRNARLVQKRAWNRGSTLLAALDRSEAILEGGGDGSVYADAVLGAARFAGIGYGGDPREKDLLNLALADP